MQRQRAAIRNTNLVPCSLDDRITHTFAHCFQVTTT
jgi:hypothetical protein